jgi:hypothetical protein
VLDLKYVNLPGLTLDQVVIQDIQLGQFLSWQLAKRIQARLAEQLQARGMSSAEMGQCVGEYKSGEFAFTLNVVQPPDLRLDDALISQIFQDAAGVVAQVLSDYRFETFEAIRLIHPATGRSVFLPKTRLEIFR